MELISVIISVYNTEKYLNKCIKSFVEQTYKNLEILLIDDDSTDNSLKICNEWSNKDKRIKTIHIEHGGLSKARNVGIDMSNGEMITFFDSDDYVDSNYIEYLYHLKTVFNTQVSVCGYNIADEDDNVLFTVQSNSEQLISKEEFYRRMLNEEGITVSSCFKLYDKKLFKDVRFPLGKICEDNGTTYKIIENASGDIAYGNKTPCYYVIRKDSIMRSKFDLKKLDMIELTDQMCDYLSNNYKNLEDAILRRRIYARFNVLRQIDYKDSSKTDLMNKLITYILNNKNFILKNKNVPKRDKIACITLMINKRLFFISWEIYRRYKYDK